MIVQANAHLGFNCKCLDSTVAFYRDVLGCREAFTLYYGDLIPKEPERLAAMEPETLLRLEQLRDVRWIVYLEWMDGFFIELFNEVDARVDNPYDPTHFGFTHFSFVVDDIHGFHQELLDKGAGGYIDLLPSPTIDRNWSMWFHDPEGNRIEVLQYGETAMQKVGKELGTMQQEVTE